MSKFKLLPLFFAAIAVAPAAHAADLLTILQDALHNNAQLAASRSGLNATHAAEGIYIGNLLPQISATAGITHYRIDNAQTLRAAPVQPQGDKSYSNSSITVNATQALFDASSWFQLRAAQRQTAQQALNFANTEQQLLFNVAQAYFNVLKAKELLDTYQAAETAYKRQLDQTQEQFNVGVVAATDVREAEASYDSARAQRISQESLLKISFETLEQLTGKQYPSINVLSTQMPIEAPVPATRQAWIDMATTRNLAFMAAKVGIDVAREKLHMSQAAHLPVIEAVAQYNYGDGNRNVYSGYDQSNSIGIQAKLPIFLGGSTQAQVRQNTFTLEQAQFTAEEQLRTAIQQVGSYYAQTNNDVLTVAARQRAIISNKAALQATEDGYEAGTRTILDVLNAQQNYYSALSDYANSRYQYVLDMLSLRQQAGVLDVDSLKALNKWLLADKNPVRLDGKGTQSIGDAKLPFILNASEN